METLSTPSNPIRKLRFSTHEFPFASPRPSPYTPFSGRRSGTLPQGTPQLAPPPLTDLNATLRTSFLDLLTAANSSSSPAEPLLSETLELLSSHLAQTQANLDNAALNAYQRRNVRETFNCLLVQLETWRLIEMVWRAPEIRARDLTTRRLNVRPLDEVDVDEGVEKVSRIVEWLEVCADESLKREGGVRVKPLDDPAYRWEYSANQYGESVSIDHVNLGGELEEVERKAEMRLSREMFRLVRAGRLEEAEEICRQVGQPWRAAAIGGGKNASQLAANGIVGYARKTWRQAAANVARKGGVDAYERAICGVFSGVVEPVLAVSGGFEDEAWGRFTVLLDGVVQKALEGGRGGIGDADILDVWKECGRGDVGVEGIEGAVFGEVRKVRGLIALGGGMGEEVVTEILRGLSAVAECQVEWVCRFAVQLALFLKMGGVLEGILDREEDKRLFDGVVEKYVNVVVEAEEMEREKVEREGGIWGVRGEVCELAAKYLSEMTSQERIVDVYGGLLVLALKADLKHEHVEEMRVGVNPREIDERRTLCLRKAGQCFMRETVEVLVIKATDRVWEECLPFGGEIGVVDAVTEEDELAIRAIEFLMFPAFANYAEALRRVTKATRRFFLCGKTGVARKLINWFQADIVQQIPKEDCVGEAHELESWRVYMEAVHLHKEWNSFQSSQRPTPVSEKVRAEATAKPGEVSYQIQASAALQLEAYKKEKEEFDRACANRRDAAKESLSAAMLFPGGWMQDKYGAPTDEETERRSEEIAAVRRIGIPQLAVLLHNVLHESGLYSEAIGLAQVIADEELQLYKEFGPEELSGFLKRIADSTVGFADESVKSGVQRPYKETLFEEIATDE